jgi:biotin carboxyl carrier protein
MKEPFKIAVNDRFAFDLTPEMARTLDIVPNDDMNYHAIHLGQAYQIELLEANYAQRYYVLLVNGRRFQVQISDHYERLIQQMGLNTGNSSKQDVIKAPMPGLVLQVAVEPGQTVQKGDTLLILEAMKMENVIKAAHEGTVKTVKVSKGNAVEKGQVLVEMD